MKRIFKLEGLDCAHCAKKIEDNVKKIEGVSAVNINFMTTKMLLEFEDSKAKSTLDEVLRLILKIEPDINIINA